MESHSKKQQKHLKSYRAPTGKACLPTIFQGLAVKLRGCTINMMVKTMIMGFFGPEEDVLVGGFKPFGKICASQIASFPQVGVK